MELLPKDVEIVTIYQDMSPDTALSICSEHGFKTLCVLQQKLPKYFESIDDNYSDIELISYIDFPYGTSNTDTRIYGVMSAIEYGADKVEIEIPYHLCLDGHIGLIKKDIDDIFKVLEREKINGYFSSIFLCDLIDRPFAKEIIDHITFYTNINVCVRYPDLFSSVDGNKIIGLMKSIQRNGKSIKLSIDNTKEKIFNNIFPHFDKVGITIDIAPYLLYNTVKKPQR